MKSNLLRWLYNILFTLAIPLDGIRLLHRSRKHPGAHLGWTQRLGVGLPSLTESKPVIWCHAVSLGEVNLSAPLVRGLLKQHPEHQIHITTTTLTGMQAINKHFPNEVSTSYFPYDHPWSSKRFFQKIKPSMLVLMETEIWLNHLHHCHQQKIPVFIFNARLSERSAKGYQKIRSELNQFIWPAIHTVATQTEEDAKRFQSLGLEKEKIAITGNIKYDISIDTALFEQAKKMKNKWGATRPTWIAASTHETEEEIILKAFEKIKTQTQDALLILVPRHPQRFDKVADLLTQSSFQFARRSQQDDVNNQTDILLVDTIGELCLFYAASDIAFVGGSLSQTGGHNLLEATAYDCPVITGPHTFNFNKMVEEYRQADAISIIEDENSLVREVSNAFKNESQSQSRHQRAKMLLKRNRGALAKLLDLADHQLSSNPFK